MGDKVSKTVTVVALGVVIACIIGFTTKPDAKPTGSCQARCFANPQEAVNYINSQGYSGNRARLVQGGPGGWIVVTDN